MRRLGILSITMALLVTCLPAAQGEILDRIIAVVNNTPIMLSDWDEAWRCEALLAGRAPESYSDVEQREIFDRLVDQELLGQQMRTYLLAPVTPAEVQERLADVRKQLAKGSDAQWLELLQQSGVTESELSEHLRRELEIEHFVDVRFRAGIRIEERAVYHYYRDEFLPQLRSAGGETVPLEKVSGKIREILTQQRLNEQLSGWIQTLREQAEIRIAPEMKANSQDVEVTLNQ